jgi:predicted dehydrogenase
MKGITRRSFLGSSAIVSATAGIPGAMVASQLRAGGVDSNDKINVAVIGAGGRGRGILRTFLGLDEVECLAIADVDERHVKQSLDLVEENRRRRPDGYRDFRRILDRKDVDVVIIGTPDHWHALPTVYACQTGKDVYVEKPLATSIGEGRVMVNAARRYDRVVQVGSQQRSAQHFAEAVEFVQSGQLGKIRQVRAWAYLDWKGSLGNPPDEAPPKEVDYDFWLGPAPHRPFNPARFHFTFRWFWDYSGGLMTDWGVHMIDIAMWAMNEDPVGAMAVGGKFGYPDDIMETPDTQQSIIEFPSFSLLWEHMLGCGIGPWGREHGVEFHGQDGILVVDRAGWEVHSETDSEDKARTYRMRPLPRQRGSSGQTLAHVKNFVECVKSREEPVADVEIAHKSVNACHLGNIAARLRTQVRWDASAEKLSGPPEAQKLVDREYRSPWKLPEV